MTVMPRPHCRFIAFIALIALLNACGTAPERAPTRPGYGTGAIITEEPDESEDLIPTAPVELDTDQYLFSNVEAALQAGDWMAATLAMPRPAPQDATEEPNANQVDTDPQTATAESPLDTNNGIQLWTEFYEARIAWVKGDLESHSALLASLTASPGGRSQALNVEILKHRLKLATLAGNAPQQVQLAHTLLAYSGLDPAVYASFEATLWRATQRLNPQQRDNFAATSPAARGWAYLAAASQLRDPMEAGASLTAWIAQYPEHPGLARATALRNGALNDAGSQQIALLLPLSGPLASAGDAVSRGFIAAHYAQANSSLSIDIIDSRRFTNVSDGYRFAQERGAQVIVGPLGKRQVGELLARDELSTPLLTLNRSEGALANELIARHTVLQLSLSPEDEARVLAEKAYAAGHRRALMVRPEGVWGERMHDAFSARWQQLGGALPSHAIYGKPSTHSDSLRNALALDASAQRGSSVRALFRERVETVGRRRGDLDAVILLSKSSEEARALKPMLNYHYAGDLDVYALSTVDSGSNDSNVNRDLNGVKLLAMPWRIDSETPPGIDTNSNTGSFAALHTLGVDAYRIARQWWRISSEARPTYRGLTADLTPDSDDGELQRELPLSEFDRGSLRAD